MKIPLRNIITNERGQTLPMVLVILAVGSLLAGGFLANVHSSFYISDVYSKPIPDNYTADAGVEDAIWGLQYGTLANTVETGGGQTIYTLPNQVNGDVAEITVTGTGSGVGGGATGGVIADHDFEDQNWAGGNGWLNSWNHAGSTSFNTGSAPHQGNVHIRMRGSSAYMSRSVDLSTYSDVRLQFWAKARSFEGSDEILCMISANGVDWVEVENWVNGDDDDTYRYYNIDLSPYLMTSEFWIAFDSEMNRNNDYFYVDDLQIIWGTGESDNSLADHDFEDQNWSGGNGWLFGWHHVGSTSFYTSSSPHQGTVHIRMRAGSAYMDRAVDLSGYSDVHLQFWAKVYSFESSDDMYCLVSPDDTNWTVVEHWQNGDDDNTYRFYDIDLSSYSMTSEFWIAFDSEMSGNGDYFYFDDLKMIGTANGGFTHYQIISVAGVRKTTVTIDMTGASPIIVSWEVE